MNQPTDQNRLTALENRVARLEEHSVPPDQIRDIILGILADAFREINRDMDQKESVNGI